MAWKISRSKQTRKIYSPCANPAAALQLCYVLDAAVITKVGGLNISCEVRLDVTLTRFLSIPKYSGCSWKNFVVMHLSANLSSFSFDGSSTSQVAKLRLQKYYPRMTAVRRKSSKVSLSFANLLVLMSMTTRERIQLPVLLRPQGWARWHSGHISHPVCMEFFGWFSRRLALQWDLGFFFALCPGWMGLADGTVSFVPWGEETGRSGHSVFSVFPPTRSSGLVGKALTVGREAVMSTASFCPLSRGPEKSPKSSWVSFGCRRQPGEKRSLLWSVGTN